MCKGVILSMYIYIYTITRKTNSVLHIYWQTCFWSYVVELKKRQKRQKRQNNNNNNNNNNKTKQNNKIKPSKQNIQKLKKISKLKLTRYVASDLT